MAVFRRMRAGRRTRPPSGGSGRRCLRKAEGSVLGGHDQVAGQRHLAFAAQRPSFDDRDERGAESRSGETGEAPVGDDGVLPTANALRFMPDSGVARRLLVQAAVSAGGDIRIRGARASPRCCSSVLGGVVRQFPGYAREPAGLVLSSVCLVLRAPRSLGSMSWPSRSGRVTTASAGCAWRMSTASVASARAAGK